MAISISSAWKTLFSQSLFRMAQQHGCYVPESCSCVLDYPIKIDTNEFDYSSYALKKAGESSDKPSQIHAALASNGEIYFVAAFLVPSQQPDSVQYNYKAFPDTKSSNCVVVGYKCPNLPTNNLQPFQDAEYFDVGDLEIDLGDNLQENVTSPLPDPFWTRPDKKAENSSIHPSSTSSIIDTLSQHEAKHEAPTKVKEAQASEANLLTDSTVLKIDGHKDARSKSKTSESPCLGTSSISNIESVYNQVYSTSLKDWADDVDLGDNVSHESCFPDTKLQTIDVEGDNVQENRTENIEGVSTQDLEVRPYHHINFFNCWTRNANSTSPEVSLWFILTDPYAKLEALDDNTALRVRLWAACQYIDPVCYDGPHTALFHSGTALKEAVTGMVTKHYRPYGIWIGETYRFHDQPSMDRGLEWRHPDSLALTNISEARDFLAWRDYNPEPMHPSHTDTPIIGYEYDNYSESSNCEPENTVQPLDLTSETSSAVPDYAPQFNDPANEGCDSTGSNGEHYIESKSTSSSQPTSFTPHLRRGFELTEDHFILDPQGSKCYTLRKKAFLRSRLCSVTYPDYDEERVSNSANTPLMLPSLELIETPTLKGHSKSSSLETLVLPTPVNERDFSDNFEGLSPLSSSILADVKSRAIENAITLFESKLTSLSTFSDEELENSIHVLADSRMKLEENFERCSPELRPRKSSLDTLVKNISPQDSSCEEYRFADEDESVWTPEDSSTPMKISEQVSIHSESEDSQESLGTSLLDAIASFIRDSEESGDQDSLSNVDSEEDYILSSSPCVHTPKNFPTTDDSCDKSALLRTSPADLSPCPEALSSSPYLVSPLHLPTRPMQLSLSSFSEESDCDDNRQEFTELFNDSIYDSDASILGISDLAVTDASIDSRSHGNTNPLTLSQPVQETVASAATEAANPKHSIAHEKSSAATQQANEAYHPPLTVVTTTTEAAIKSPSAPTPLKPTLIQRVNEALVVESTPVDIDTQNGKTKPFSNFERLLLLASFGLIILLTKFGEA
ncbi:MAG: hypothetical protein M1834_001592 [Cirrosporium novae-zelandiae]|nr:MAG: hypothetical protein M1834_004109 [Cirrosporium novae-zelandiae]KAI9735576.1 MAG: hypothetical protein M1834_001592 [Cirrosporium novae-zelandiae]